MQHGQTGSQARDIDRDTFCLRAERSYYAEVSKQRLDEQGNLLDQIIGLAFDTLDARHLDLRIVDAHRNTCRAA
jgi:hypothetical protein